MKSILLITFLYVFVFTQAQTNPLFKIKVEAYGGDGNCNGFIRFTGCDLYLYTTIGPGITNTSLTSYSSLCPATYTVVATDMNTNEGVFLIQLNSTWSPSFNHDTSVALFSTSALYTSTLSLPPNCNDSIGLNIRGGAPPYNITWLDSIGNILPNESDSILQNICSYNYNFFISDAGFCTNNVGNNYVKFTEKKSAVVIFPNPSDGNFTIKLSKSISNMEIKSITGQTVYENNNLLFEEKKLSLNLEKGIYFVVSTNTNGSRYFEKLVVN